MYRTSNYQIASISNELLEATAGAGNGAFVDEAKLVVDTAFRNHSNDMAGALFGSGTGSRGQIASYNASLGVATIVLASRSQITQIEVGMKLVACTSDGGAPSATYVTVLSVNRAAGSFTATESAGGSMGANWAANSYVVVSGDIGASGASTTAAFLKPTGLGGWLPTTAPTSGDAFWGVDRSQDSRLYGTIVDGSALAIEEALIDAGSQTAEIGGSPDMIFVNFASFAALEKSLGSKVMYAEVRHEEADIGFKAIQVHMPYGTASILPDRSCPAKIAYGLSMESWKLRSLGRVPHILTYGMEGLEALRQGSADALEVRIGSYSNLTCNAPCHNFVCKLSA